MEWTGKKRKISFFQILSCSIHYPQGAELRIGIKES
jgi:hypothetical protein